MTNKLEAIKDITDNELESLICPTFQEQDAAWKTIIDALSVDNVSELVKSLGFELLDFNRLDKSEGVINRIYILKVKNVSNNDVNELILRISNPHKFWNNRRTKSEVAILKYLKQNTNITLANILSYSTNSENGLKCEYILMEKLKGKTLSQLIKENKIKANEIPDSFINEMIGVIKALHGIKLNCEQKIGCFDENMNLTSFIMDGATIGVFDTFLQFTDSYLKRSIDEMKKIKKFQDLSERVENMRTELNDAVLENKLANMLNYDDEFYIYHGDLNASNILVDPETWKLTGIIDWEFCCYGFDDYPFDFFQWWVDKSEHEEMRRRIESKLSEESKWHKKLKGEHIRKYLKEFIVTVQQLSFYVSSWFTQTEYEMRKLEVRNHINNHSKQLEDLLLDWPTYLKQIKDENKLV